MLRRFLRAIKNYFTGPSQSHAGEDRKTQRNHSHGPHTGTSSSPVPVSLPELPSENVKSHRPALVSIPAPSLASTSLEPQNTLPAASDDVPPPPYVANPPGARNAPATIRASPAPAVPDLDAEISNMVNNILENTLKLTQNVITNLPANSGGVMRGRNGNLNNRTYAGGASTSTNSSKGCGSTDSTFDIHPERSGSTTPGRNGGTFYQTNGPGYTRNVFVASDGAYMANMGNTISITGGSRSTGSSSNSHYSGTNVWNTGSPQISMHTQSLSVNLVGDSIVINGRKYPKKQGLGPLGRLSEITAKRVVVEGHIYYPEPKST